MIVGLAHINLTVPPGTLALADEFYGKTLALKPTPVPTLQKGMLTWFDIGSSGQQVHVSMQTNPDLQAARHPCFKIDSPEALLEMQRRIWEHHSRGDEAAPMAVDEPGAMDSGAQGVEYPRRFFARDFAGNRLEFSL